MKSLVQARSCPSPGSSSSVVAFSRHQVAWRPGCLARAHGLRRAHSTCAGQWLRLMERARDVEGYTLRFATWADLDTLAPASVSPSAQWGSHLPLVNSWETSNKRKHVRVHSKLGDTGEIQSRYHYFHHSRLSAQLLHPPEGLHIFLTPSCLY